jgi:membrane-bound ClpP family serine protease
MSIGTGIVLFVIGAILTFAVNIESSVINLDLIGYILMGAGLVVFIIGMVFMFRRRSSVTTVNSGVNSNGQTVTQRKTAETNDSGIV